MCIRDSDPSRIGVGGVSFGAATALQLAPLIPEAPFVLADSSYSSISAIIDHRATELLGPALGGVLTPGALWIAGLRAGFDPADVSPETAIAEAQMPILLIHSRTDDFTPYTHSAVSYTHLDVYKRQSKTCAPFASIHSTKPCNSPPPALSPS